MARTFSTTKQLSAFVLHRMSLASTCRRGYVAEEAAVPRGKAKSNATSKSSGNEVPDNVASSWYPDPVTGYYRPEGQDDKEVDAADLRKMFLKNRNPRQQ